MTSLSLSVLSLGPRDHVRGPATAPVTLLEYGDYECPFCGAAYPAVEAVRGIVGDRVRFAYRHFPLTSVHPHAEPAAEAAEAAGAQGRFWAMHDRLYTHQDALDDDSLLRHAEAVGLDLPRFAREWGSGLYRAKVREDFMSGVRSGVNGTPTFYVNGIRHDGPADAEALLLSVERALRAA